MIKRMLWTLTSLAVVLLLVGCGDDDGTNSGGPVATTTLQAKKVTTAPSLLNSPYWSDADWLPVTSTNMSTGLLYGDGELNMSGTFGGTSQFNGGASPGLTLKAAYDENNLYLLAEWMDSDLNLDRRRWRFNGPSDPRKLGEDTSGWTSQKNDDKIGFAFEIEAASSGFGNFGTVGCAAACHNPGSGLDMRTQVGKVDIWHWKVSRSEPLGYVNDQISDPDGRKNDAGGSIENRNRPSGGNNRIGPKYEWDGTAQAVTRGDGTPTSLDPAYYLVNKVDFVGDPAAGETIYQASCASCHGVSGSGGIASALNLPTYTRKTRAELTAASAAAAHAGAGAFNALNATQKTDLLARLRGLSGIPGYYLTVPTGSQADIITKSNLSLTQVNDITHAKYQLLIIRKLQTGNADDVQFNPSTTSAYKFGVGLMDDDGRNHVGSRLETLEFLAP